MGTRSTKDLYGSETTLYDRYMSLAFVQTQRTYTTKSEPKGKRQNLGDNDVSMQVHRLQKKFTTPMGDADGGEGWWLCRCGVNRGYMGTLYFLLNFLVNLKLL